MPIIKLRLHFTGSRRRDVHFGILAGFAAWVPAGLIFSLVQKVRLPNDAPHLGVGLPHLVTGGLLLALFVAVVFKLSRKPYARAFLGAMVITAAMVPPLVEWVAMTVYLYHHG